MDGKKKIPYEIGQMPDFLVDQLTAGILPAFFPVSFVYDQKQCTGIYHTEHYQSLASLSQIPIQSLLNVFCQLISMLAENEKHYVFGETYQITKETIYVNQSLTKVKFIFQPLERLCTTKEQLIALMDSCRSLVSEEGIPYLEDMILHVNRQSSSFLSAIRHGEVLQNEIYICEIT